MPRTSADYFYFFTYLNRLMSNCTPVVLDQSVFSMILVKPNQYLKIRTNKQNKWLNHIIIYQCIFDVNFQQIEKAQNNKSHYIENQPAVIQSISAPK